MLWGHCRTLVLELSRGKCRRGRFTAEGAENAERKVMELERKSGNGRMENGGAKFPYPHYKRVGFRRGQLAPTKRLAKTTRE